MRIIASLLIACPFIIAAEPNLAVNPGFEDVNLSAWTLKETGATMTRDTAVKLTGKASLRLEPKDGIECLVSQTFKGLAGKRVTVSAKVRVTGPVDGSQVFALMFDNSDDQNWKPLGWKTLGAVQALDGWQTYGSSFDAPADAGVMLIGLQGKGTGTLWMDDFVLTTAKP